MQSRVQAWPWSSIPKSRLESLIEAGQARELFACFGRPIPMNRFITALLILILAVAAVACGASEPARTVGRAGNEATTKQIPHRVLADGLDIGSPWSTEVVTDERTLAAISPDVDAVDFEDEVVFALNPAESGSCPFGPLEGLEFETINRVLYPVVPLAEDFDACTDDDNPHLILVAVAKADLPPAPFEVWVNGDDPPKGVASGVSTYLGDQ